jgi:asparagine synthase (glutamine-hydrolysing)
VIARDRLGIKPLYFARSGDLLVFASELKSLLASGLVAPELDYEAIDAYLSLGFVPGPRTPLAGVSKLLPGHRLVIADRAVRIERYWAFPEPEPGDLGEDEYAERLLAELEESVRLRLMSDVPLGAMLSGGIDSSVIVALMARNMSEPVKTFSVGFREAGDENELARARAVADFFGTDHHELELSLADQDVDLAELVWHLDEPLADLSALGFLTLSELAARHVTVALSGQGADEMLGGYRKHLAASLAGRLRAVPAPLRALAPRLARLGPPDLVRAAETLTAADPASRLLAMSGQLEPELRARLVRGPLAELDGGGARRSLAARLNGTPDDPLATTLYLDAQLGLVDDMLHYFDRTSMAYSLEVRVPFLDHRFVEFAATIPNRMKVRGLTRKALLRRVARGLVPEDVVERGKVSFFRGVVDEWFRSQTEGAIADYLLGQNARSAELLDRAVVERLVRDHISGADRRHAHLLNAILMLEVWLAEYLPRALRHEPARDYVPVAAGSS